MTEQLPAPLPSGLGRHVTPWDLAEAKRQNELMAELIGVVRKAPSCEGCVCYREVARAVKGKPMSETVKMCAHPAYSEARVDYVRAKLDFLPRFTCLESRTPGTICGPEGRLFVESFPREAMSWSKVVHFCDLIFMGLIVTCAFVAVLGVFLGLASVLWKLLFGG